MLLHGGIALVMANELVVHTLHVEGQMHIREGETVNYVFDVRSVELAVVDPSDAKTDDVVVVPGSLLTAEKPVQDVNLPFEVQTVEFLKNATLKPLAADQKNLATAGAGLKFVAVERPHGVGTDVGGNVDTSAAYVKLLDKETKSPIGTYLVGHRAVAAKGEVGDKKYEIRCVSTALQALRDRCWPTSDSQIPRHAKPRNYSSGCAAGGPRAQRRPGGADLDEQSAAVRRRDVLSEQLFERRAARSHGAAGGDQRRLDDSLRRLHDRGHGHVGPVLVDAGSFLQRRTERRRGTDRRRPAGPQQSLAQAKTRLTGTAGRLLDAGGCRAAVVALVGLAGS